MSNRLNLVRYTRPIRYDKLLIDDDVFVYNDVERRIERLPYTVTGRSSHVDQEGSLHHHHPGVNGVGAAADGAGGGGGGASLPYLQEDTPSATLGRHRQDESLVEGGVIFDENYFLTARKVENIFNLLQYNLSFENLKLSPSHHLLLVECFIMAP